MWSMVSGGQRATDNANCAVHAPVTSWADVAHQLGYADQAHLTGAVRAAYGAPPAAQARQESGGTSGRQRTAFANDAMPRSIDGLS